MRTVNTCSAKFDAAASSVARNVNVYVPGVVGDPTISVTFGPPIVPLSMRRPGGNVPAVNVHAYVEDPLVRKSVSPRRPPPTHRSGGLPLTTWRPDEFKTFTLNVRVMLLPALSCALSRNA